MVKFNTHFDNPIKVLDDVNDKVDSVEREGIIPLSAQIKMYKESGVLLKMTRALQYDSGSDMTDFEKIDTVTRDCKDYAEMSELTARAIATAKAVKVSQEETIERLAETSNIETN